MPDGGHRFCDLALPVPVNQLFTYELPDHMRTVAQVGSRAWAPFGSRRLTGVIVRLHDTPPEQSAREILKLVDAEAVLNAELLGLARWVATYYCAPLGEVLKGMLPLGGEVRRSTRYSLTEAGRGAMAQLSVVPPSDTSTAVLMALQEGARTAAYLNSKISGAKAALRNLAKRGWVTEDQTQQESDRLRAPAERLVVEFLGRSPEGQKLTKRERELLAFLELHPGPHNLAEVSSVVNGAAEMARALGRRKLLKVERVGIRAPPGYERPVPILNTQQQAAFSDISSAINGDTFASFLLHGVTGSGKTEVYLRCIESAIAKEKNALLLVPEIALTPAVAGQFFHRFGKQVAILHSAFNDAERAEQWRRIQRGDARVIVGTRSGVFAPVRNLGLIIIDEEHDGSYKQQDTPRYHARDVALIRAREAGAVCVLGSATPSVESRFNTEQCKSRLLVLPERIAKRPLPNVELVDMRTEFLETKKQATFSRRLLEKMDQRLKQGEQAMLLMNRRGFASFMVCRSCGERLECANCSVVLTHHRRDRRMLCHYCGYMEKVPATCPKCGSEYIQFLGAGSERVEDEIHEHLPHAKVARLDRDTASVRGALETVLQAFRNGNIDILVGTQMIAKGHDIPNVTLVGVVLADIGLRMPDFRAAERTFQLLTQAAGRAGRGDIPGKVIIQTLNPDHYAVQFAARQDYEGFYAKEIDYRKWLRYPPYAVMANVLIRAEKQEEALRMATQLGMVFNPAPPGMRIVGPAEAPILRVKNEYRYQMLIKAANRGLLRQVLDDARRHAAKERWSATALTIDVDPISLM